MFRLLLRFLKSFADGAGTAAGVAFPFFGVTSALMFVIPGSFAAMVLGGVTLSLFILFFAPIFFWSLYTQTIDDEKSTNDVKQSLNKIAEKFHNFFLLNIKYYLIKNHKTIYEANTGEITDYLIRKTNQIKHLKLSTDENELRQCIQEKIYLLKSGAVTNSNNTEYSPSTIKLTWPYENKISIKHIAYSFIGFGGGFGTILGGTVGLVSLLTGVSVVGGLAAIPVVGWCALAAAILLGTTLAIGSYFYLQWKEKKEKKLKCIEKIKHGLDKKLLFLNYKIKQQDKNSKHNYNMNNKWKTVLNDRIFSEIVTTSNHLTTSNHPSTLFFKPITSKGVRCNPNVNKMHNHPG